MALSGVALVLGPIVFQNFEIPDGINFGGDQRLAVHQLPGGPRVIDVLGDVPADITWSGVFSGAAAAARASTLETMRVEAAALTLSWDVFLFSVVIKQFEARYHNSAWVPYRLTVSVLGDAALSIEDTVAGLVSDVLGDGAAAAGYATPGGIDLSGVTAALAAPGATVLNTGAFDFAATSLATGQRQVRAGLDRADASLGVYAAGLSGPGDVAGMIAAAGTAATLSTGGAYLGRIAANMINVGS